MLPEDGTKSTSRRSCSFWSLKSRRCRTIVISAVLLINLVVIFAVTFSLLGQWAEDRPIIDLGYAKYRGVALPNGVSQWLGVRYAAAPVGNLRFAAVSDGIEDATEVIPN
jgi:hypothetical protein